MIMPQFSLMTSGIAAKVKSYEDYRNGKSSSLKRKTTNTQPRLIGTSEIRTEPGLEVSGPRRLLPEPVRWSRGAQSIRRTVVVYIWDPLSGSLVGFQSVWFEVW